MNKLEGKWLLWQVAIPLLAPIIVSGVVILAWLSGSPKFSPNIQIAVDVSPWALTFYTLTLIGSTLNEFWPKLTTHVALGLAISLVATAVTLYAAFMVIWRHDPAFVPGRPVYLVALSLLFISVVLCHIGYQKGKAE
jgi:hypothetical protein